ncbi:MAG: SurA N-terminal domain-containing protein [Nannocystaceae bacterium]
MAMIQGLRQSARSIFAWIILGVLALGFGFSFGLPSDAIGCGAEPLVRALGEPIRDEDYQYEYAAITQLMMPRSQMDPQFMELMGLKEEVMESVIEREILADTAEDLGLSATQEDAEDLIFRGHLIILGETLDLLRGEPFNYDWFKRRLLPAFQTTEPKFLEYQREELLARTLRDLVSASTPISEGELRAAYDKRQNQLSIRYVRFESGRFGDLVDPSPEQVDRWLADHKDELQRAYASQGVRFTKLPKQVRLRFLQVQKPKAAPADADKATADKAAAELKAARAKIDGAATRLAAGEDMRALARELSDDPGSARRGGDYGWVSIEGTGSGLELVVDEAAKGLEVGKPSGVVEGDEAFYLVQVDGVREGDVPEEEALRELAEEAVIREGGRDLARQAAKEALEAVQGGKKLSELFKAQDVLGEAGLEALRLGEVGAPVEASDRPEIRVTGLFAKDKPIPSLGPQPELIKAAWEGDSKVEVIDQVFEVGSDFVLAGVDRREVGDDEGYKAARAELFRELREQKAARLTAYFAHRVCLEAKARGDITGNDARLGRLMTYDTQLGTDEAGKRLLKPYVICDRVGNRGGMARLGAAMANPSRG